MSVRPDIPAQPALGSKSSAGDAAELLSRARTLLLDGFADEVAERVVERLDSRSERWLGVEGAANYLACPTSRIYDWVAQERVKHARDGRRLLFRREWLDEALERCHPVATRSETPVRQRVPG